MSILLGDFTMKECQERCIIDIDKPVNKFVEIIQESAQHRGLQRRVSARQRKNIVHNE